MSPTITLQRPLGTPVIVGSWGELGAVVMGDFGGLGAGLERKCFSIATNNMAVPVSAGSVSQCHIPSRRICPMVIGERWYLMLMIMTKVIITYVT